MRFLSAGHEGFPSSHGSVTMRLPPGVMMTKVAWPSQVIERRDMGGSYNLIVETGEPGRTGELNHREQSRRPGSSGFHSPVHRFTGSPVHRLRRTSDDNHRPS